jgi:hypothetical protein
MVQRLTDSKKLALDDHLSAPDQVRKGWSLVQEKAISGCFFQNSSKNIDTMILK